MRFYTRQHQYYCGIDLHTQNMYVCIVNQAGKILYHYNLPVSKDSLLSVIDPYLPDVAIAVECIFTWYWIADFCSENKIPFVLGHALYMKAIHGAKTKNDKIDSHKIAMLLRAGMIPMSYVYPAQMRSTRDLLRRRMYFVHKRSELLSHIQNTKFQHNLSDFQKRIDRRSNRIGINEHFEDPGVRKSIELDMALLDTYELLLKEVQQYLSEHAKENNPTDLSLLRTIPGVGKILALVILYEIHDMKRFASVQNFVSYARLIKPKKESAGKTTGAANRKMGNAYLRWAFGEAAILMLRERPEVKKYHQKLKSKHGKAKALAILTHRIGRSVYYMLTNKKVFDIDKFIHAN
jgi:transposase